MGNKLQGSSLGAPVVPSTAPNGDSPFIRVGSTMSRAQQLAQRVCALSDRLVGQVPEEADYSNQATSGSVFGDMHVGASTTNEHIDAAMRALDRIESDLP